MHPSYSSVPSSRSTCSTPALPEPNAFFCSHSISAMRTHPFKSQHYLESHMRTHTEPHILCQFCLARFRQNDGLKRHINPKN
jgi:hypothetical protein